MKDSNLYPGKEEQQLLAEDSAQATRHADAEEVARILKLAGHEPEEPSIHQPHEAKFDDPDQAAQELEHIHKVAA